MRCAARIAFYCCLLALGLYQAFRPTFESGFARIQTHGDGMLNHYILENSWKAISDPQYPGTLSSPPFFFPERHTIWYSEHLFGAAPPYWLLRLGLTHDLAYQWWQIVMAALNFVAFAAVARWLGVSFTLSLLGAYLWAFGLVHIYQLRHQQLIPRFWMPLAAYHAWSFVQIPSARALNRMLACVFLQCIICMNTGWFLIGALAVFLPIAAGLLPGGMKNAAGYIAGNRLRIAAIVGGWAAALVAAFLPYVIVNWGISRSYEECAEYMPTVAAWLAGPPGSRWQETLAPILPRLPEECLLFSGFCFLALNLAAAAHLYIAVRQPARPPEYALAAACLLTAAVWVVLTITPNFGGHSLWEIVRLIPGGKAIRNVARVYTIVYLFAVLGVVVWLTAIARHYKPRTRMLIQGTFAALVIFEQTGYLPESFEKADFYPVVDRLAAQLRGAAAGDVAVEPYDPDPTKVSYTGIYGDVVAMWAGLRANVPVVNGWSGRFPRGNYPKAHPASDERLRAWLSGKFHGKLTIVPLNDPESRREIEIE